MMNIPNALDRRWVLCNSQNVRQIDARVNDQYFIQRLCVGIERRNKTKAIKDNMAYLAMPLYVQTQKKCKKRQVSDRY
jgi:hypothetical protein